MGLKLEYIEGQTPIDEDEKEGLLIPTISTRGELNEFEQANIEQAIEWTLKNRFSEEVILTEEFLLLVHRKMFGEVWEWAGKKRNTNKNIGVDKYQISTEIRKLIQDYRFWIGNKTFSADEIAIRFSHRIVQIHLFPNGNGRHSRLVADIIISNMLNGSVFSWGSTDLSRLGSVRSIYLEAIHRADAGDYRALIDFART
jgi:Fic-DOC domain mobile mystery protein B